MIPMHRQWVINAENAADFVDGGRFETSKSKSDQLRVSVAILNIQQERKIGDIDSSAATPIAVNDFAIAPGVVDTYDAGFIG